MSSYRRGAKSADPTDAKKLQAVFYLRVSSIRQTHTSIDIDADGNSIATQREDCRAKAAAMSLDVVHEFVEPGKSAQTIDKRPVFRQMLAYVSEHPEVGYIIVYSRSRAFRNVEDAVLTRKHLRMLGVKIVSTKEDFGDSLEAEAMETVSDTMNDLQNRRNGEDIRVKMAHKARNGGTIGRAPIGYLNTRVEVEGRLINSVIVDEQRAPLVRMAFELYATGDYTLEALREVMTDQGLAARPNGRWRAERPVSQNSLARILADPYYAGYTYYDGELYDGRHPALISQSLFDRVQDTLDHRSTRGTRFRTHEHYLRGLLRCDRCVKAGRDSRLIYTEAKGRNGSIHTYYFCRSRQQHLCDLPHLAVARIERAIEDHYNSLALPAGFAEALHRELDQALAAERQAITDLHRNLNAELVKLDEREERLLDALMDDSLPQSKIRARLNAIQQQKRSVTERLRDTTQELAAGADILRQSVELGRDPHALYENAQTRPAGSSTKHCSRCSTSTRTPPSPTTS